MALNKKVTALNAYTTPLATDVMEIVDIAGNESKKITIADLLGAVSVMPKVYKAYITQAGGAAPTVIEIVNTIGAIVWTRTVDGVYVGTLAAAFTAGKTFITMSGNLTNLLTDVTISWGNTANTVTVLTYDGGVLADDIMVATAISIEVYP